MFYRYRRRLATWRFNQAIRGAGRTPPVEVIPAPWSIVSMVSPRDWPMYLVTMKAFYRRIGAGKLVAVVERAMQAEALDQLRRHFPGILLETLEDIDTGFCQRGGTWERLLYILDRSADEYVMQVDCDTLPVAGDLREVTECIRNGTPFAIADNARILSLPDAAQAARATAGDYVGIAAERLFDHYPDAANLRYVRGSSAFAGFARGGFTRAKVEAFHRQMEAMMGRERWREWGTEQCASNFAIANSPGAVVLPYPQYANFFPGGPRGEAKFLHFMGAFRFQENYFADCCRAEIRRLETAS
jgi:hypothetical protein